LKNRAANSIRRGDVDHARSAPCRREIERGQYWRQAAGIRLVAGVELLDQLFFGPK
jgi:hypothetical protein